MTDKNALSPREQEILRLTAKGLTNREIAQALFISPNTVKVHLSNIFEKTGAASRTEATLYGMEHGIVDVPGGEAAAQPAQPSLRETLFAFRWVWVAMLLLVILFGVTFTMNVLLPAPTPEPPALAEMAERWKELAPMPEPRAAMAAVTYDGKIYAIAGEGPEGVRGEVFRYIPEEDRWEQLSDKPTPVADVQGALIGEKIYVPGGRLANRQPTDILEIYDPRLDTWIQGAHLPKAISAYALADFEGKLYMFGGWDGERALADVYIYEPGEDEWREGTRMGIARQDAGAVALRDKIVVLGGRNRESALDQAHAYFPTRDITGENPWGPFVNLPSNWYGFGAVNISDTIYIIGGSVEDGGVEGQKGLTLSDDGWVPFSLNREFSDQRTTIVPLGSRIIIFDPENLAEETRIWSYQAFYYTIYIPFMP